MTPLDSLAELCDREPIRAKWVFVPTHHVGHTLGERLARRHGGWVNLRFVTPLDIAIRMAGPFLIEEGIDPSDETLGPALMMRLLLSREDEHGYFRALADQPSMGVALWRTIAELRLAGVRATHLEHVRFQSSEKQRELTGLLASYEQWLATSRIADAALVFEWARSHATYCPLRPDDLRTEWPATIWAPSVRALIDVLPGTRVAFPALDVPGLLRPRRLRAVETIPPPPAARAAARLAFLLSPDKGPRSAVADDDRSLQIFHAGGREAEIDEVLRRIQASGVALDDVEVACASGAHALLAWEKAIRLDWPVTVSTGVPATLTRPGRAALAWCDWIAHDFAATRLRRLLQSGDIAPRSWKAADEAVSMSAGQGARLLLRAGAAWGRHTYAPALARLRAAYEKRAGDDREADERRRDRLALDRIALLVRWIDDAIEAVPREDDAGLVEAQALAAAARAFLAENAIRGSVLDGTALVSIDDSLREMTGLGPFAASLPAALRLIRERVSALRVGSDRARPGALHVSTLESAGLAGRALLFVTGLEEGRVFPNAVEDPVLLDDERAAIHAGLRRSSDRLAEAVYAIVSRLAAAGVAVDRTVCLSFSCRDTREFRETFPSWIVLQAFRLLRGDAALSYGDLAHWLGEPVSAAATAASLATSDSGWWLAWAPRASHATEAAALEAYPALARGRAAELARASPGLTRFDGHVPEAGAVLDFVQSHRVVSASTLEDAAACPFRFFLRHGLGIEPLDEGERQPDAWLDALTRGRELHDLFADALRASRREGRRPDPVRDWPRLLERGEHRLATLARELPPPSDEVFLAERNEFLRDLRLFLEAEGTEAGGEPVALEVSFGLPIADPAVEPLALEQPVHVALPGGGSLGIRGRIDRIDRCADGTFETIDYKTGRYWADDWKGTFAGGRRLQHALYGVAAAVLLQKVTPQPVVTRGTYYFPSARGLRQRKVIPTPDSAAILRLLGDLAGVVSAGAFVQAPLERTCRWCEFAAACGARPWQRAGLKLTSATELDAYRRLQDHA